MDKTKWANKQRKLALENKMASARHQIKKAKELEQKIEHENSIVQAKANGDVYKPGPVLKLSAKAKTLKQLPDGSLGADARSVEMLMQKRRRK